MKSRTEVDLAKFRFEKAIDNLRSARDAFSLGHYDHAVGRAYYAIFSAMRSLLALKKLDSKSHKGVIMLFGRHFIKEKLFPKDFHRMITEAKVLREKAEYGDFVKVPKEIALRHIANAEHFVLKIEGVLKRMFGEVAKS